MEMAKNLTEKDIASLKFVVCGPFTNAESEKYLDVLPAAGKYLYNLAWGLQENGAEVVKAVYVPYSIKASDEKNVRAAYKNEKIVELRGNSRRKSVAEYQDKILAEVSKKTVVVFYNMNYSLMGLYRKVVAKGGKPLLIVADHGHSSACKDLKRKLYAMACEREFKKFKKVIILSAQTKIKFNGSADVKVMEGGIKYSDFADYTAPIRREKIQYTSTGSLKPLLGVDMLLEAIHESKRDDFTFMFSGRGESVPDIESAAKLDSRIYCKGFLSRDGYTKMMEDTNVFVSARNMEFEKNNNSFPSKILEYLATGRIIVSTRFPGYQKFDNHILFYNGSTDELLKIMDDIASNYDVLAKKYYDSNRKFAESFDWKNQAQTLMDFVG